MKNWLAIIAVTFALFGSTVGALEYFAKAADLELVAMRLEQKIESDRAQDLQNQIWQMEDRYRGTPEYDWAPHDLDRYRRLKKALDDMRR